MSIDALSLLELNTLIKEAVRSGTDKYYRVTGEISEMKVNFSGHCYLELVQKDEESDRITARSRATIWSQTYRLIKPYFETTTGQPLVVGLKILVKVSVEFHEVFGLSLNIHDIEPEYTVGDLALRRQKVIDRLTDEGVIDMNRELELPVPCRKIAVVSSETAAGLGDFIDQLKHNQYGYKFYIKLFPAVMQGAESENSIIGALDRIYSYEYFFDAVAIIRGGGSQADLNCYNSYWLAYHIAQFPIPVLTGIGHEQDDSVADRVAHTRLKTPTAVAAFLVDSMKRTEDMLSYVIREIADETQTMLENSRHELFLTVMNYQLGLKNCLNRVRLELTQFNHLLIGNTRKMMNYSKMDVQRMELLLSLLAKQHIGEQNATVASAQRLLNLHTSGLIKHTTLNLNMLIDSLRILNPVNVLQRGYSVTRKNGKILRDTTELTEGDTIETLLYKGTIQSSIKKIEP